MSEYKRQEWINAEGVISGHRAFLRKNVSLLHTVKSEFPHAVIVNLVYRQKTATGVPAEGNELSQLDLNEESIADAMCRAYQAQFGLAVTSDGTRDLFFFLPSLPEDSDIQDVIEATEPSVDYDFSIHHDPEWRPYVELVR